MIKKGLSATETIIPAGMMATWKRPVTQKLIFHSDRGIQYACDEFSKIFKAGTTVVQDTLHWVIKQSRNLK